MWENFMAMACCWEPLLWCLVPGLILIHLPYNWSLREDERRAKVFCWPLKGFASAMQLPLGLTGIR
jgi:hypothetical protein